MNVQTQQATPRITAIATSVPDLDVHAHYSSWAQQQLTDNREAAIFERMVARGGIDHRWSVLSEAEGRLDPGSFYNAGASPGTAERMRRYGEAAPDLAMQAIRDLPDLEGITHFVLASCTGFMAPGLDQVIARKLGLSPMVERSVIGFMGCYAGITALRSAAHLVRSDPSAKVLVLSVELCTLHMQHTGNIEALLAMSQFADGAAAAIVSGTGAGLALGQGLSMTLEESHELITWNITDTGFAMHLSGAVPARFGDALGDPALRAQIAGGGDLGAIDGWAVHPGGRSVLDAVERGLDLAPDKLAASRNILQSYGNMSSATVMFVLREFLLTRPATGIALAFGPGLALEGLHFGWIDDAG